MVDDKFTGRMLAAVDSMLLDVISATASEDCVDRQQQVNGTAKPKALDRHKGRPEHADHNAGITAMLRQGSTWGDTERAFRCSRHTVAPVRRRICEDAVAATSVSP